MRWIVILQVALGLAALFGLAHRSVESVVGPVVERYAETAARAEARAAAAHLDTEWQQLLQEQQAVVRELAATESFGRIGRGFARGARERALKLALESAVAQAGGRAQAALIGADASPIIESEGAPLLAASLAAQGALGGAAGVHLEKIEGQPRIVTATPLQAGNERGALVLSTPLDVERLREMTQVLPAGTLVAVALDGVPVVHTGPEGGLTERLGEQAVLQVGEGAYALASRPGEGGKVEVAGLAPVRGEGAVAAVQHVQLLVIVLGGLAFLIVAVLLMLSAVRPAADKPAEAPRAEPAPTPGAPAPAAPAPPAPVAPAPAFDFPSHPAPAAAAELASPAGTNDVGGLPPPPEGSKPLELAFSQKTVPNHQVQPSTPGPIVAAPPEDRPSPSESQDFEAPIGGGRSPFAPVSASTPAPEPTMKPPPAPTPAPTPKPAPVPALTPSGRQSAIITTPSRGVPAPTFGQPAAPPSSGSAPAPAFSAAAPPTPRTSAPAASPFDAIANAAVSRPPAAPAPAPTAPPVGASEDLPAPKGGVPPEMMAAERAKQQRVEHARPIPASAPPSGAFGATPYDSELPAPKAPGASSGVEGAPSPATEPPRQPPGATQPPPVAIPLPGSPQPARNPWENPSVPSMPAPKGVPSRYPVNPPTTNTPATSPPQSAGGSEPYDEAHYRSVYNEFVSSKAELGESVENISYEGFRAKLRSSEEALLGRHGCRAVRFQVLVKDRTVSLRPQLVR